MNVTEHLLTCLAEEGGEVSKECHKALRFGLDDKLTLDPHGPRGTQGLTNREKLIDELNDLLGVVMMLTDRGIIPKDWQDPAKQDAKTHKVARYMDYALRVGSLVNTIARPPEGWIYAGFGPIKRRPNGDDHSSDIISYGVQWELGIARIGHGAKHYAVRSGSEISALNHLENVEPCRRRARGVVEVKLRISCRSSSGVLLCSSIGCAPTARPSRIGRSRTRRFQVLLVLIVKKKDLDDCHV